MNTVTQIISTNPYLSEGGYFTIVYDEIVIKGGDNLVLDLQFVDESKYDVKYLSLDWGDGKIEKHTADIMLNYYNDSIISELLYNKGGSVCTSYRHTYNSTTNAYFTKYAVKLKLVFFSGTISYVFIPVKVSKTSFYDKIGDLNSINTQIVPLSTSNTLLNIQTTKEFYAIPIIAGSSR
jgi:hypothetical protein